MGKKGKNHKVKFKYDIECLDYEIRLKRVNYKWLWWLLILLLLLSLLIPLKKDLNVQTESEAGVPIENAEVQFEYNPRFLYTSGELFPVHRYFNIQTTNAHGVARFENIEYSVFSLVVQLFSQIDIQAIANGFKPKNVEPFFHFLWNNSTVVVRMQQIVLKSLQFRTIDGYDHSLLGDVGLQITVSGESFKKIMNSGRGEFMLLLPAESHLSITAEKQGFETNQVISDRLVSELVTVDPAERDIVMELPPCSASGDDNIKSSVGSVKEYDMRQERGLFKFDYDTNSEPDHIIVYNCRAKDRNSSHVIFDKHMGTKGVLSEKLVFTSRIITVEVQGTTVWNYTVNCAE